MDLNWFVVTQIPRNMKTKNVDEKDLNQRRVD